MTERDALRDRMARRLRELRADVAALKLMLRNEEAAHREAVRERDELRRQARSWEGLFWGSCALNLGALVVIGLLVLR